MLTAHREEAVENVETNFAAGQRVAVEATSSPLVGGCFLAVYGHQAK
jgi:hypothetical protein